MDGEKKTWKPGGEPDEHHGMGGTYTVDPATGKRTLVDGSRTEPPKPAEANTEAKE